MTGRYKYFKTEDFDCQETGENQMKPIFIHKLDTLREACGFPFIVTSGYRSPNHSIEKKKTKEKVGTHAQGIASDIRYKGGTQLHTIVQEAMALGFTGIGIHRSFVHVDIRELGDSGHPIMWAY
jgi:zinc D-Ala-D-Ala carboxypeptidase